MTGSSAAVTLTKDRGEPGAATEESDTSAGRQRSNLRSRLTSLSGARLRTAVLAVVVAASVATVAVTYFFLSAPDNHSDSSAKESAIAAATSGTVALLSYSPATLTDDLAAAKNNLTGEFLTYYTEFTEKVVAPAAQENAVDTQADVVRSAVSDIDESSATVLVFINQTTTSTDKPDPALTASSVRVTLTKVDGTWKISAFDPV